MTPAELAQALADGAVAPDQVDWSQHSGQEWQDIIVLAAHLLAERRRRAPQLRALRLFRSWLRPAERAEFRRSRCVTVTGTAGGRYRIWPCTGLTQRIERHGKRWFGKAALCLHPDAWIPPADIALAHYLNIRTDEPAFLARANEHQTQLWDGAYLRRLNAARRRQNAA